MVDNAAVEALNVHFGMPVLPNQSKSRDEKVPSLSSKLCRVGNNCLPVSEDRRVANASTLATPWGLSEDRQTTRILRMGSSRNWAVSMSSPCCQS
ncbi:hypothetical protein HED50_23125 [Ochrobactrum oryzae]|nr:hypothetical protein [Brucella oryzae]